MIISKGMPAVQGIYQIINNINHKKYIGSSWNVYRRLYDHFELLKKNKHNNYRLQHDWNLFHEEAFSYSILKTFADPIPQVELLKIEEKIIQDNKVTIGISNMYNIAMYTGRGFAKGHKHTEESKAKMSKASTGRKYPPISEETRRRLSDSHKGKKLTEEHKAKISASGKGRIVSKETREKQSKLRMGWSFGHHTEEAKQKISLAQKNRIYTDEEREALSKAQKLRWAKKRAKETGTL